MDKTRPIEITEALYAELNENCGGFCIECRDQAYGVEPDARPPQVRRTFGNLNLERQLLSIAADDDDRFRMHIRLAHGADQFLRLPDDLFIPADNHVGSLNARRAGWRRQSMIVVATFDPSSLFVWQVRAGDIFVTDRASLDTQPAAGNSAFDLQPLDHMPGNPAGNREADTLKSFAQNGRVDPHDLASHVDQRPAAVARVHCGIRLEEVLIDLAGHPRPVFAAEDPERRRALQSERASHCPDQGTDLQFITVAPVGRYQRSGLDLQQRQIRHRVETHHAGWQISPVA
jgi:hypothetical protein